MRRSPDGPPSSECASGLKGRLLKTRLPIVDDSPHSDQRWKGVDKLPVVNGPPTLHTHSGMWMGEESSWSLRVENETVVDYLDHTIGRMDPYAHTSRTAWIPGAASRRTNRVESLWKKEFIHKRTEPTTNYYDKSFFF